MSRRSGEHDLAIDVGTAATRLYTEPLRSVIDGARILAQHPLH